MITIILDSREASTNKGLKKSLQAIDNIIYKEEELRVGDILVGNYLIERKSVKDILTSILYFLRNLIVFLACSHAPLFLTIES